MNRDGKAETGVSISAPPPPEPPRIPLALPFVEVWLVWVGFELDALLLVEGGSGLAKGFGGPDAPADWIVDVEGLGGGRVIIPIVLLGPPE